MIFARTFIFTFRYIQGAVQLTSGSVLEIFTQSREARNLVGIGLSYSPPGYTQAGGIDSLESLFGHSHSANLLYTPLTIIGTFQIHLATVL